MEMMDRKTSHSDSVLSFEFILWVFEFVLWVFELILWVFELILRVSRRGGVGGRLAAAATARRELSHLARPRAHSAQGPNILFGESLSSTY